MPDIRPSGPPTSGTVRDDDAGPPSGPIAQRRAFADPHPRRAPAKTRPQHGPAAHIALAAEPLPDLDDPAFGRLFDRFGDARVVMLGEACPGTSEFARTRAAVTRWLVENRGFNIVALDADWPDGRMLDSLVRGGSRAGDTQDSPGPCRSAELADVLAWLKRHNAGRPPGAQAGVYGLDRYNLAASTRAVATHLDKADAMAAAVAHARFGCPAPWDAEGRTATPGRYAAFESAVTSMLVDRLARLVREGAGGGDAQLDAAEGARLVRDAEAYYRTMFYGGAEAWNLRTRHMFATLKAVMDARGGDAKAVVWAHNAHVGDARATEMGVVRDAVSLGQLARETWPDATRLIGLATHAGGARALRPSLPGSHERQAHDSGIDRFLLDLRPHVHSALRRALADPQPERFVGATYRPETERASHYAACRLPEQFDAWVWFDETRPVTPLPGPATGARDDGAWPSGL